MEWCQTVLAFSIWACTLGQENLGDWNIAILGCNVKWSEAFLLYTINQTLLPTTKTHKPSAETRTQWQASQRMPAQGPCMHMHTYRTGQKYNALKVHRMGGRNIGNIYTAYTVEKDLINDKYINI